MEHWLPGWEATWRHVGWPFWSPFALQLCRGLLTPLLLLLIPRNHPRRGELVIALLLFGLTTDLIDGTIARALRMTGLKALGYGDLCGDLCFWIGAALILRFERSLARDLPPDTIRRSRALEALWVVLCVILAGAVYGLIMNRTLTIRWT